ncbi:MAG TPA: glycosyltransferase family 39 protein [Pyrinomonadaceae bacterium]
MTNKNIHSATLPRHRWLLKLIFVIVFVTTIYVYQIPNNPAGFYVDESSIAYNAYTISQTGRDEHGVRWPLFFAAFGEYKSPVYIYLLAPLLLITGPSIVTARLLSAAFGLLTALIVGVLATSMTKQRNVGLFFGLVTALTPWIFELSRVSFEVAMYPALTAFFLLCVWKASQKTDWSVTEVALLVLSLALLTYSYSIGRLLGPLLAFGLIFFATRRRLKGLIVTWAVYVLTVVPAIVFQLRHPEALTGRFRIITYINGEISYTDLMFEFVKRYLTSLNPWRIFIRETSKVSEIIHIPGAQPMLITTALLALLGIWLVISRKHREAWWRYVFYGLAVSIVPASLTNEYFHMLRLATVPVFLIVIGIPAVEWLFEAKPALYRTVLPAMVFLTVLQGLAFQYQYYRSATSPIRRHIFDADYLGTIFEPALARGQHPIYLADVPGVPGYIQAYWYAALRGLDRSSFIKLPPEQSAPAGVVVITTEEAFQRSEVLGRTEPYTLHVPLEPPRVRVPLPDSGFRALIQLLVQPGELPAGQKATLPVKLKNISDSTWLARERSGNPYQVSLGNHWLSPSGTTIRNDDGRSGLRTDLQPGGEIEISLTITAPAKRGDYLLELDMLQEGVSWFALKGSQSVRIPVSVR